MSRQTVSGRKRAEELLRKGWRACASYGLTSSAFLSSRYVGTMEPMVPLRLDSLHALIRDGLVRERPRYLNQPHSIRWYEWSGK